LVPWDAQSKFTNSDNYLWDKSQTGIVVNEPGIYELAFGFFTKKQPIIQVNVNGEPILSGQKQSLIPYGTNEKKGTKIGKQAPGGITGITHMDYIHLPAKARLSLAFNGDTTGEGFLSLRKI